VWFHRECLPGSGRRLEDVAVSAFPSLMAVYDTLFFRGQVEHLQVLRAAMADAAPGLAALTAGLQASGRWALANRAIAQLMFWRPVPSFEPSARAFTPSVEMVASSAPHLPTPLPPGSSVLRRTPMRLSTWFRPLSQE
jgi:hypothetical protein